MISSTCLVLAQDTDVLRSLITPAKISHTVCCSISRRMWITEKERRGNSSDVLMVCGVFFFFTIVTCYHEGLRSSPQFGDEFRGQVAPTCLVLHRLQDQPSDHSASSLHHFLFWVMTHLLQTSFGNDVKSSPLNDVIHQDDVSDVETCDVFQQLYLTCWSESTLVALTGTHWVTALGEVTACKHWFLLRNYSLKDHLNFNTTSMYLCLTAVWTITSVQFDTQSSILCWFHRLLSFIDSSLCVCRWCSCRKRAARQRSTAWTRRRGNGRVAWPESTRASSTTRGWETDWTQRQKNLFKLILLVRYEKCLSGQSASWIVIYIWLSCLML